MVALTARPSLTKRLRKACTANWSCGPAHHRTTTSTPNPANNDHLAAPILTLVPLYPALSIPYPQSLIRLANPDPQSLYQS